jgi:hypothetical protein
MNIVGNSSPRPAFAHDDRARPEEAQVLARVGRDSADPVARGIPEPLMNLNPSFSSPGKSSQSSLLRKIAQTSGLMSGTSSLAAEPVPGRLTNGNERVQRAV